MPDELRILMLEDNPADRELIEHLLRSAGLQARILCVETREEFLEALDNFAPKVILTDYRLPAFDGLAALELAQSRCPDVPCIFVSGVVGEEAAIETLKNGATDYVLKHRLSRLVPAVTRALREAEEHQARRRSEEALRELSGRLLRVQDEERRRMARELHDGAAQNLAALTINLTVLANSPGLKDPRARRVAADCLALAEECTREVRAMSYLLHPPLLDELGLESALRSYVEGFSERSGIRVSLDIGEGLGRLHPDVETAVFRIVQEGLANVHRHSGSHRAWVRLERRAGAIRLEVRDEGRGIPPRLLVNGQDGSARLGVGILGMRERARQLGGTMEIQSSGGGTTLSLALPLELKT